MARQEKMQKITKTRQERSLLFQLMLHWDKGLTGGVETAEARNPSAKGALGWAEQYCTQQWEDDRGWQHPGSVLGTQQDLNLASSSCTLTGKTNGSDYWLLSDWLKPFETCSSVTPLQYLQEQQTNRPQESRHLLMSQPSTNYLSLIPSLAQERDSRLYFCPPYWISTFSSQGPPAAGVHMLGATAKQDFGPKHSPHLPFPTALVAPQPCQLLPVLSNTPTCKEPLAKLLTIRHQCTSPTIDSAQNTPSLYLSRG